MRLLSRVAFYHKLNEDGTWDSVCMKCFLTIATVTKEDDLEEAEQNTTAKGFVIGLESAAFVHRADLDANPLCINLAQDRIGVKTFGEIHPCCVNNDQGTDCRNADQGQN